MPVVTLLAGGFALNNNPPPSSGGGMPNKMLPLMGVGLLPTMLHLLMPKLQLSTGVSLG
jgi:hypothetical protein